MIDVKEKINAIDDIIRKSDLYYEDKKFILEALQVICCLYYQTKESN